MVFLETQLDPSRVRQMDMVVSDIFKAVQFTGRLVQELMKCMERFWRSGKVSDGNAVFSDIQKPMRMALLMVLVDITTFNMVRFTGRLVQELMKCMEQFWRSGKVLDGNKVA